MPNRKIFTYVSPKTNHEVAAGLCNELPIILRPLTAVEELFPLMSDPSFHTDFVCISIETFLGRADLLDMFDIIHTLATLIKSTIHRESQSTKPRIRDTKIMILVDESTDPKLVKETMNFPDVVSVGWICSKQEDFKDSLEYVEQINSGDFSHDRRALELIKPKKKPITTTNIISLTSRQSQILQLVQDRGASNKTIAKMLGITESTVKLHIGAVLKKYGVRNRTQLALFAKPPR